MSEQYVEKPYELVGWTVSMGNTAQGEIVISVTPTFRLPGQEQFVPSPLFVLTQDNARLLAEHLMQQLHRAQAMSANPLDRH